MRIRNTTLAALCLAFVSVVAYSAAGDRFFSNPTSNKDVVIQVNKAGVTTDVMTLTGAAADVAIGAASATGTGFNVDGKGLRVHNPATALDSRANMLLTNAYAGAGGSAMGGIAWLLPSNTAADKRAALITSDTEAGHTGSVIKSNLNFYTNNGAGVTPVGVVSGAGAWALGPSASAITTLGTRTNIGAAVIGTPAGQQRTLDASGGTLLFTVSDNAFQSTGGNAFCFITDATSNDSAHFVLGAATSAASVVGLVQDAGSLFVTPTAGAATVGLTYTNTNGKAVVTVTNGSSRASSAIFLTCLVNGI